MSSVSNIIEVHHLTFQYNGIHVFQDLHFELQRHKFVGLFGANGSGKKHVFTFDVRRTKMF